jgi:hypothetical protein
MFMNDVEMDKVPLFKYYQSRLKVMAKKEKVEMVVGGDQSSSEDERTAVEISETNNKLSNKKLGKEGKGGRKVKKSEEIGGVEDLVEDFELSSDGGEENE